MDLWQWSDGAMDGAALYPLKESPSANINSRDKMPETIYERASYEKQEPMQNHKHYKWKDSDMNPFYCACFFLFLSQDNLAI